MLNDRRIHARTGDSRADTHDDEHREREEHPIPKLRNLESIGEG